MRANFHSSEDIFAQTKILLKLNYFQNHFRSRAKIFEIIARAIFLFCFDYLILLQYNLCNRNKKTLNKIKEFTLSLGKLEILYLHLVLFILTINFFFRNHKHCYDKSKFT